jgi:hypothetical protein
MKNNFYPIAGLLVFVIPFLGFPVAWRNYILSFLGLLIFLYSIWPVVSQKFLQKPTSSADRPETE